MTVPVWPFRPDWSNPVLETYEWLTNVLTSRSGAEQRQALRVGPRRMIDYPVQLYGNERSLFDLWMMKNGASPWYVPVPSEGINYRRAVAAGDTSFPGIDLSYRTQSFQVGMKVVLQDTTFNSEVVEVTSLVGTTLAVTAVQKNYPRGCVISPAIMGQITDTITMSRKSGAIYTGTIRFMSLTHNYRSIPSWSGYTYSGYPILTMKPNAINDLEYTYERPLNQVDNKTSIPKFTDPRGFATATQKYDFFLYGRKERSDFLDLIYTLQGQLSPIWVPTFNDDLAPGAGWIDPDGYLGTVPYRGPVAEFRSDGTVTTRKAGSGGTAIPALLDTGSAIRQTSFMSLKRLGVDSIELSNYGNMDGVATASVLFRDAPDLRVAGSYFKNPFVVTGDPTPAITNPTLDMTSTIGVSGPSGG